MEIFAQQITDRNNRSFCSEFQDWTVGRKRGVGAGRGEDKNLRAFLCEESCADSAPTVGFPKLGMLAPIISRKVGLLATFLNNTMIPTV